MVEMIHRQNSSLRSFGYLIVKIENIQSPIIVIKYISFIHIEIRLKYFLVL